MPAMGSVKSKSPWRVDAGPPDGVFSCPSTSAVEVPIQPRARSGLPRPPCDSAVRGPAATRSILGLRVDTGPRTAFLVPKRSADQQSGRGPAYAGGFRLRPSGYDGQVGGQAARDHKSAVRGPAATCLAIALVGP